MTRIAYFDATWEVLLTVAASREAVAVTSTLPTDAVVHHLVLDHERRSARIYFTSGEVDDVAEGAVIPAVNPSMKRHEAPINDGLLRELCADCYVKVDSAVAEAQRR